MAGDVSLVKKQNETLTKKQKEIENILSAHQEEILLSIVKNLMTKTRTQDIEKLRDNHEKLRDNHNIFKKENEILKCEIKEMKAENCKQLNREADDDEMTLSHKQDLERDTGASVQSEMVDLNQRVNLRICINV